jgi:alpha/beta superfamily hydrolase
MLSFVSQSSTVKGDIMTISQETRATARSVLWGAVAGAIALAIVGFSWGGWVTGGSAETLATSRAATAVVAALTPICVEKFRQAADASANLTEMKKATYVSDQSKFVEKGGWATMPGSTEPNSAVARACAESLGREKAVEHRG